MNKLILCAVLIVFNCALAQAQQSENKEPGLRSVYASAKGDDSYLLFSDHYEAGKKYTVFKFWNEKDPLTETENSDLAYLKKELAKKNIEVTEFQWKGKEDLESFFKKYNLSVSVLSDKRINLKAENYSLNTTSGKALLVFEDGKPLSLCSGKDCEDHLKFFFGLKSVN